MTKQKFKIIAVSALTTLMTSAALADAFEEFRPDTGRPGHERPGGRDCERAKDNLDRAADIYRSALSQLQNIGRVCGGNPACISVAQAEYNAAVSNLSSAQAEYNRACR